MRWKTTFIKRVYKRPHGLHNRHISTILRITSEYTVFISTLQKLLINFNKGLIIFIQLLCVQQIIPPGVKNGKGVAAIIQVLPLTQQ